MKSRKHSTMKDQKSKMAKRETENTVTVEEKGLDGIDQIVSIAGGKQLGFGGSFD